MKRRHFLAGSIAAGSTFLLPDHLVAAPGAAVQTISKEPWQRGFNGASQAFKQSQLTLEGVWPADAFGSLYRNTPALIERGNVKLQHWFDGDGMVHKFTFNKAGVSHTSQFVATEKYLREEAAGRFLYNATGTQVPNANNPRNNDTMNVANTALLPWQNELLALWEGGSAYRLDPESLRTLGEKQWGEKQWGEQQGSQELVHAPFSAHPLLDKDGNLWNFGFIPYAKQPRLLIYHINPKSQVIGLGNIVLPQAGYLHAFAQTRDYLVFYISACLYESGATYIDSLHWRPEAGSKLLVIPKNALDKPRWFDIAPGLVFHFGNAWQDKDSIHLFMSTYKDARLMLTEMPKLMKGEKPALDHPYLTKVRVHLQTGIVKMESTGVNLEFPNYDPQAEGNTPIYGTHASSPEKQFLSDSLAMVDPERGVVDRYCFGDSVIVEEPLLIKSSHRNHYLMATYYDYIKQESGIAVLDARKLSNGPIARANMNQVIPLGFHGCFIPA